jgi:hypothetical protein
MIEQFFSFLNVPNSSAKRRSQLLLAKAAGAVLATAFFNFIFYFIFQLY